MYKLLRRISRSFFPSHDLPSNEDATSTAPQIGQKRRHSSEESGVEPPSPVKKQRPETPEQSEEQSPVHEGNATGEVEQVTEGVTEIELEDKIPTEPSSTAEDAATVPLPDSPITDMNDETASTVENEPTTAHFEQASSPEPPTATETSSSTKEEVTVQTVKDDAAKTEPTREVEIREIAQEEVNALDEDENGDDEIPGLTAGAAFALSHSSNVVDPLLHEAARSETMEVAPKDAVMA
ncbi:uncharacterized protein LAESUDRAFT_724186 [Laetiporus sulphureus 93-53]|uniref:Uncharacterized protein n=1 Tax=Laetiporus sulphureus 93-53 TaxID=1314785 RepID=A0A165F1J5_9APHY|nr:uncharacterized protein LAESUDRAFT_724186 [Laetiporus sulphureus 93-53]KZT08177.1 hypothetical protein LAESUDRAFT_724186 [Laetiporus sulphureus 93-53]